MPKEVEIAVDYLKKKGIEFDEHYNLDFYIGSGAYADVYKVKNKNKVIKVYNKKTGLDFDKYSKLVDKNFKNVVKVFFNRELSIPKLKETPIGVAVLELLKETNIIDTYTVSEILYEMETYHYDKGYKVTPFENLLSKITSYFKDDHNPDLLYSGYKLEDGLTALKKIVKEYKNDKDLLYILLYIYYYNIISFEYDRVTSNIRTIEFIADNDQFFKDVYNGIKELESVGILHEDIHAGNILYSEKEKAYKLIDPI